ncbi:peptidoglycan DD-metalloendopeptidase family protein [Candidatus Dojkabacteria bacterium]|nr:peptidoglycan DD-metalloendopeptidase family protein [Candidatus Dojkabacteria bacterium]
MRERKLPASIHLNCQKNKMIKGIRKSILISALLIIQIAAPILLDIHLISKASAASGTYTAIADTFTSVSTSNPANGNRRFMPIGTYYDPTISATFSRSRALIKFNNINLPSNAIIKSAKIQVWHYGTNTNNQPLYVSRITSGWNESTVHPGPSHSGDYGSTTFPYYNSNGNAALREIPVNTSLISALRSSNNGVMLRNYNETARGVVICASEIPSGPCKSGMQPKLVVNYELNQTPLQPNLDRPQSNWELGPRTNDDYTGVSCDLAGTGAGCNVEFRARTDDPDNTLPLTNTYQIRSSEGGNLDYSYRGEGWNTWNRNLSDGHWSWRGKSVDVYGADSGWTGYRNFIVDTTAPTVSEMAAESEYSPTLQNEVDSSISSDNLIGGVQYEYQKAEDAGFTINPETSGWIDTNNFIFAGLEEEKEYFYRVRARDGLWNTTDWSSHTSSTQDATFPVIETIEIDNLRISPANQDGILDNADINSTFTDLHLTKAEIEIYDWQSNLVLSHANTSPSETGDSINYIWGGKDLAGNFVADGSYNIKVIVTDKAGNETVDDSNWIIIDNEPADLSYNPGTGSWFNSSTINISGQTEADATLEINNSQTGQLISAVLDGVGKFSENLDLNFGLNEIEYKVTDQTGNINTDNVEYFREEGVPSVTITSPSGLINEQQLTIDLELSDTGHNEYISGIDIDSLDLSIIHGDTGELVLIENGTNIEGGSIVENCSTSSGDFGNSGPKSCQFSYTLAAPLQPDGNWEIRTSIGDVAGNLSSVTNQTFELDSHIHNEISQPNSGQLFNYSLINLTGTAERGAQIDISLNDSDGDGQIDSETFTIEPQENGRILVNNCQASSTPTQDGIKEICDWQVSDFQLEKDLLKPGPVKSDITFSLVDPAGNTDNETASVDVDLYAVNLNIDTNIDYFSPNGDGRQDGVDFVEMSTDGQLGNWEVRIENILGERTKTLSGEINLPESIAWDGRDEFGQFVPDGEYTYHLYIKTTDGIEFTTSPQSIFAVTDLGEGVIITNPKNESFTTKGVIEVQGQAPMGTKVRICDNVVGLPGNCDFEYEAEVNDFSSFSHVVPLYRLPDQANTEHFLSAKAYDKYGNETEESNIVKITVTNNSPFKSIEILPAFTGVNNETDYQIIIDKLNSGEEITQADIDSLRSVIFRSTVNQGTERVKFAFAEHTNLENFPSDLQFENIGWIDNGNSTHLYQEFEDGSTQFSQCNSAECIWDFYYPIPPIGGALYEIEFDGKLGEDIQKQTAALSIDGNIPTTPMILDIDKVIDGENFNANLHEEKYYSNSKIIEIKGVSDPGAAIIVSDLNSDANCLATSSGIGFWSCQIDASTAYSNLETNTAELELSVTAALGENTSTSLENEFVVIDKVNPEYIELSTPIDWHQSGDVLEIATTANEKLSYSKTTTGSTLGCINDDLEAAVYDHNLSTDLTNSNGSHIIPGIAQEGRFCLTSEIQDLAGNRASQELVVNIDNTAPLTPTISTDDWGLHNGINTKPGFIAKGRLVPEFVHEENSIIVNGFGELGQTAELFINGTSRQSLVITDSPECFENNEEIISDGVTTLSKCFCPYSFTFNFNEGESDYQIQVKVTDLAGNESIISEDEVVYLDQTLPDTPATINAKANGQPIVDWQFAQHQNITASKLGAGNLGKLPITNQKEVTIEDYAEARSDYEYDVFKGSQHLTDGFIQKANDGKNSRNQRLDKGDGVYTFQSRSTDAAGNASALHKFEFELDTVPPKTPTVNEPFLCGNNICINASGENGADLVINGVKVGKVSSSSKQFTIKYGWDYLTTYNFSIKLMDRATNSSQTITKSITTPGGFGDGGDVLGTETDPYGGQNLDSMDLKGNLKIIIDKDGNARIKEFNIPAPVIHYIENSYDKDLIGIYGLAINGNYNLKTNVEVHKEYYSFRGAVKKCGPYTPCVAEKMGITIMEAAEFLSPFGCRLLDSRCKEAGRKKRHTEFEQSISLNHVELILNKANGQDLIQHRSCDTKREHSAECFGGGKRYWNGDPEGKFNIGVGKNVLETGNLVQAKVRVFTDFSIDAFGKQYNLSTAPQGIESSWSNQYEVPKLSHIPDYVHPLIDNTCTNPTFKYVRGKTPGHSGVDLSRTDGCEVNSIANGKIKRLSYDYQGGGFMMKVKNDNGTETWYLHIDGVGDKIKDAKFYVKEGDIVDMGKRIAYMGNTGWRSKGTHLHITFLVNGSVVNPEDNNYLGDLGPSGTLYKKSRGISYLIY